MQSSSHILDIIDIVHSLITKIENSEFAFSILAGEKQVIKFKKDEEQYVYFLISGSVEICRISDNKVVYNFAAPAIIGLLYESESDIVHYIKVTKPTELKAVNRNTFLEFINENNLWMEIFEVSIDLTRRTYMRDELFASRDVYSIVRMHIEIFWTMYVQNGDNSSLFDFILNRTTISRSSLNKIIKELNAGGYIKTYRGKLIEKKRLPLSF